MSIIDDLIEWLPWNRIPAGNRTVYVNHTQKNKFCGNQVSTTKYNPINFIPKNLFEQFTRVANLYFLFMSSIQLFSGLSPTGRWSTPIALIVVVILQMVKDAYEDIGRYLSDRTINNQTTIRVTSDYEETIKWKDIIVGDVIKLKRDEPIPADMIMLSSSNSTGKCYVETSQLDGEANLKVKEAINADPQSIVCEGPNKQLYEFAGVVQQEDGSQIALRVDNLLLRGSTIKNTDWICGAVIYTGKHSRIMMNSRKLPHKSSKLESITNRFIVLLFIIQTTINTVCAISLLIWNRSHRSSWYLMRGYDDSEIIVFLQGFISYFMLYGQFVPLALYVTLEIARLLQTRLHLEQDIGMYHDLTDHPMSAKSTSLTDDLGQVEHIFADKTGTLTQNQMNLISIALSNGNTYDDLSKCDQQCDQLFEALSLCHTVVPELRNEQVEYQASSPDELALVVGASRRGFRLLERESNIIRTDNHSDQIRTYEILALLEFSYERKRMSVIVKDQNGQIHLFCKGADSVLEKRIRTRKYDQNTLSQLKSFSGQGLRTLVICHKTISEHQYQVWYDDWYHPATTSLCSNRKELLQDAMDRIEQDLLLLGVTAIQDLLQDQVPETIKILNCAGVKMWVLTGDKQETAVVIGYACNILDHETMICDLSNCKNKNELMSEIQNHSGQQQPDGKSKAVVIDGDALDMLFGDYCNDVESIMNFLKFCLCCKSVICCRVSPDQKANIVNMVRDHLPQCITLAIGDGANDVSMIRTAHVGVGIVGQEGRQASNASDYAFAQFKFLQKLLLVHGRWNYRRVSKLILFSIYKSIALNVVQMWFFIFNGASGTTLFEPFLLSLFYTVFTGVPIGFFGVLDKDVSDDNIIRFPELYAHGAQNYHLNLKVFVGYTINSFIHSFLCFFIPYLCYSGGEAIDNHGNGTDIDGLGLASYTCVIMVVTFKLVLETRHFTLVNHATYWCSLLSFFLVATAYCLIPGPFYFAFMNASSTPIYWATVILTTTIALMRDLIWKSVYRNIFVFRQLYHELQDYDSRGHVADRLIASPYSDALQSPVRAVSGNEWYSSTSRRPLLKSIGKVVRGVIYRRSNEAELLVPSDDILSDNDRFREIVDTMTPGTPGTPVAEMSSSRNIELIEQYKYEDNE
ncbi:phospholipid-transporting ATPase [Acrasis kona]|uniref:Phospholipid-transporting ATPase n=1 Tax=Acrasis kona TaxID=1008807 RepID=A0AAW2ZEE8_9EUKA